MKKNNKEVIPVIGIAWYRADQWERLHQVSIDRENLHEKYEDWVKDTTELIKNYKEHGIELKKVKVNVEKILKWCRNKNIPVDSHARSEYVADKLRRKSEK